jgi:CheY-like chemotaxis protein
MPEMDGVPRVMLSSGAVRGDADRCRELGVAAYFGKPLAQQELLAGLHTVLGGNASPSESAELVTRHSLREACRELKVLLVEDHCINQKLAISLLEKWGHVVTLAQNGQEALDRVNDDNFDVILMDLQMPVMGGLEATQRLRTGGCRTHIIAMTANAMEGDRQLCLSAGMDDYISKPIKADDLYALLHRLSGGTTVAGKAEAKAAGFDYVRALATADSEIVEVIAPMFIAGYGDDLANLRSALANGDCRDGARAAHTLRGVTGNFKAEPVVREAKAIEDALHRGDLELARSAMPGFADSLAELVKALRERAQLR